MIADSLPAPLMRVRLSAIAAIAFGGTFAPVYARPQGSDTHATTSPSVSAEAVTGKISIDGRLDEPAWQLAKPATEFKQSQPDEGKPGSQRTEVRFLYDAEAIYIGARMYDSLGAAGVKTGLVRRDKIDESLGDFVEIIFDTFHDHLTQRIFLANPSGVKWDGVGRADAPPDDSWDPVWEVKTRIDSLGWTAEMRIPFNQLRYARAGPQTWGLQIWRFLHRRNEEQMFAFLNRQEIGGPARFGHLEGLILPAGSHSAEITPYVVGRSVFSRPSDPLNPFTRSARVDYRIGADVKYLLTPNLTLDATINPDFGQVELDPADVNLSAFETFFPEKRTFFIEGASIFSFGSHYCFFCSSYLPGEQFYSRRIGRAPQGTATGTFVNSPDHTTILGAAKVTGRTGGGVSLGILDALTGSAMAQVMTVGTDGSQSRFETEVEPRTNYLVGRAKKEFSGGNTVIGGFVSSVLRDIREPALEQQLDRGATIAGGDWNRSWKQKEYSFIGDYAASYVIGSSPAILRLQRSSARYFQRPDRSNKEGLFSDGLDSTATLLSGYRGFARLAKVANEWEWESAVDVRSPGYEGNDLAYLPRADYIWTVGNFGQWISTPSRIFRSRFTVVGGERQHNFSGDLTRSSFHSGIFSQLANYWIFNAYYIRTMESLDDKLMRGGPIVRAPGSRYARFLLTTDRRNVLSYSVNPFYQILDDGSRSYSINLDLTAKPMSNLQLSAGPAYSETASSTQFLKSEVDSTSVAFYGRRTIFGALRQRTALFTTRANYTVSPTMTLEVYAQPFISAATYSSYQEFLTPRASARHVFPESAVKRFGSGLDRVDSVQVSSSHAIGIPNPDFNFRSLRGNAVFRWEYRPGSTLFLVWQQTREDTAPIGDFNLSRDRAALFAIHPRNIFQLKINYWMSR